jgi:hypothetical protein
MCAECCGRAGDGTPAAKIQISAKFRLLCRHELKLPHCMCRVLSAVAIFWLCLTAIWMQPGTQILSKTDGDSIALRPNAISAISLKVEAEHSAPPPPPPANQSMASPSPLRVLCLGDSLTVGYTRGGLSQFNHPYATRLEQKMRDFLDSNGTGLFLKIHGSPPLLLSEFVCFAVTHSTRCCKR